MRGYEPTSTPDNDRLSDSALLNQAIEFAAAADAYTKTSPWHSWMTLHFLLGRAIELVLKANAIRVGATENQLRKVFGHDIKKSFEYSKAHGLAVPGGLSAQEENSLYLLGYWYMRKLLEYPLTQGYVVPNSGVVRAILHRLIAGVFVATWGERRYQYELSKQRRVGLSIDPDARYDDLPVAERMDDE